MPSVKRSGKLATDTALIFFTKTFLDCLRKNLWDIDKLTMNVLPFILLYHGHQSRFSADGVNRLQWGFHLWVYIASNYLNTCGIAPNQGGGGGGGGGGVEHYVTIIV